jgi:hypothetical protein
MGIRSCGVLSVHLVIGICAGLSLFPAHLLSHAEVPPNTGYEKIFEGSNVSAAKDDYAKKSHYEHSQEVLKATAVNINVTVATGEEVICQVKNVNTSQPLHDDKAASFQIPTDAKAADYAFSKVPYMLYNTNTHIIEGWWGQRLDVTRIMLPVRPLWFIEEGLKLETHKLKKVFFKAMWPMKQKNKVVKRSRPTEKPLLSMCSLKNMGQIKENNNTARLKTLFTTCSASAGCPSTSTRSRTGWKTRKSGSGFGACSNVASTIQWGTFCRSSEEKERAVRSGRPAYGCCEASTCF